MIKLDFLYAALRRRGAQSPCLSLSTTLLILFTSMGISANAEPSWKWAGWGGGGFYYSTVFHPTRDGVIYMGGDVTGVYKSEDHGRTWRLINNGLADYGVFSLAVDATAPETVFAATEGGLCKSLDGGEHWRLLPNTGRGGLRLTGEKTRSIRCVAVDPSNGKIVYAASPGGKVYKTLDGSETWNAVYGKSGEVDPAGTLRVQFGKVNDSWFGGFWFPVAFPQGATSSDCLGFAFRFKGDGTVPRDCFLTLKTKDGAAYRSRNLRELFKETQWKDITLQGKDFVLDPDYAKAHPNQAKAYTGQPNWSAINRMDLSCVGPLMNEAPVGKFGQFSFALTRAPGGSAHSAALPYLHVVREFSKNPSVQTYGNIRIGSPQGGPVYSVAVAQTNPALILAATDDAGLVLSRDAGQSWKELPTPRKASSVAIAPTDSSVIYATFFKDGVWKSTDGGQTWKDISPKSKNGGSWHEVAVSPANPLEVYVIGAAGWSGAFFYSRDGGQTWTSNAQLEPDYSANPTLPNELYQGKVALSAPQNIAINPKNPKELFIAANWRPCHSEDGGCTWRERVRGADISCVYDLRFLKGRTYVSVMDEGVLTSEDDGQHWRGLWPLKYAPELGGHYWRLAPSEHNGMTRIVSTCSPWNSQLPGRVVISQDGGKSFSSSLTGLPATVPTANTMWGTGSPRALAADPKNPNILYLGIDGDPSPDRSGGGIFKSEDGGLTWKPLAAQPASRRMFFGLAVDPTDSKRLYWGACGNGGGLYRSEDGGLSWQHVFTHEQWIFNVHVTADGVVYCPGKNLWRSADHGQTWKQMTKLQENRQIVAVETDPSDPNRVWFAALTWDGSSQGGVYETTDGGKSWREITGDLPYRKPLILRYNPDTHDLWAAGVCLFKCRR